MLFDIYIDINLVYFVSFIVFDININKVSLVVCYYKIMNFYF